ncbi:MAG: hypothetical protein Q4P05_02095 [Actinomycetaceae bacterium]|nr:hypothetical protein [Actinomycetaceae bacterium]
MKSRHPLIKRLAAGISALAIVTGLSACSAQPGTALSVDGKVYSEDEVSAASQELSEMFQTPYTSVDIINMLIPSQSAISVAKKHNIEMSDEDVRKAMATQIEDGAEEMSDTSVDVLRSSWMIGTLQQTLDPETATNELLEALNNSDIDLNPRYGGLSKENLMTPPILLGVLDPALQAGN